tara:strand:+ start:482 stop:670 length:189 start_codon:yes stop_codon:yes gene_type:complete
MRVYVPDKEEDVINEVLKDLYMLKQAIDHNSGTADSRMAMVDNIRDKLRNMLDTKQEPAKNG